MTDVVYPSETESFEWDYEYLSVFDNTSFLFDKKTLISATENVQDFGSSKGMAVIYFDPSDWSSHQFSGEYNLFNRVSTAGYIFKLIYRAYSSERRFRFQYRAAYGSTMTVNSSIQYTSELDFDTPHVIIITWDKDAGIALKVIRGGESENFQEHITTSNSYTPNLDGIDIGESSETTTINGIYVTNSFTIEQRDTIAENPYQLFKTDETVQQEYCLAGDGVGYVELDAPLAADDSNGGDYEFYFELEARRYNENAYINEATLVNYLSDTGYVNSWQLITATTNEFNIYGIYVKYTADGVIKYCETYLNGAMQYSGVFDATIASGRLICDGFLLTKDDGTDNRQADIKYIKFIDYNNPSLNRFWEFNQTRGDTVACHYSGELATLTNFPADSGYVREENPTLDNYNQIVGYQFDGSSYAEVVDWYPTDYGEFTIVAEFTTGDDISSGQTIVGHRNDSGNKHYRLRISAGDLISEYPESSGATPTLTYTLSANSTYNVVAVFSGGTQELFINENSIGTVATVKRTDTKPMVSVIAAFGISSKNGFFKGELRNIELTDTTDGTNTRNYDFTTGDTDQIIDTVGGNHATITNASTAKWQPVIPKEVFTVGGDGWQDYANLGSGLSAQIDSGINTSRELIVYGIHNESINIAYDSGITNVTVQGANKWVDKTQRPLDGIAHNSAVTLTVGRTSGTYSGVPALVFKDLLFQGNNTDGTIEIKQYTSSTDVRFENSYLENTSNKYLMSHDSNWGTSLYITVSGCVLLYPERYLSVTAQNTGFLYFSADNCIFQASESDSGGVYADGKPSEVYYYNNIINRPSSIWSAVKGTNGAGNIANDDSFSSKGTGIQDANLLTYFNDPANGDYTINETGQAALTGAGWNGSNIAEWAWDDTITPNNYNASITSPLPSLNLTANATYQNSGYNASITAPIPAMLTVVTAEYENVNYNANATAGIAPFTATLTATYIAVNYEASIGVDIPLFSSDATATYEHPISNASATINTPTFAVDATAFSVSPTFNAVINTELPSLNGNATASYTNISYSSGVDADIPAFSVNVIADYGTPTTSALAAIAIPSFLASADVEYTQPEFNAIAIANVPAFKVDAIATFNIQSTTAQVNLTVPAFKTEALATFDNVAYTSEAAFSLPSFNVNCLANSLEFDVESNLIKIINHTGVIKIIR